MPTPNPREYREALRRARAEATEDNPLHAVHRMLIDQLDQTVRAAEVVRTVLGGAPDEMVLFSVGCPNCGELISVVVTGAAAFKPDGFECGVCHTTFRPGEGRPEDEVVLLLEGRDVTARELAVTVAAERRKLGQPPPPCDHGKLASEPEPDKTTLCLECGEFIGGSESP